MAAKYDHKSVEKKWQKKWADENAFAASDSSDKEKLYVLDMFPYPSGAGLHVGHVEGYTATDIYSRFKRMQGYNVLHPMGWDAFGLPAENYAIKTGIPPAKTTEDAIAMFRTQIQSLGLSYDWSREVGAHRPDYYKWTQWFFLFLYKNGLAEKRMAKVNWCPKDQTVLANEQTVSETGEKGVCFRCGTKVVQKDLEQWFFKITQYADQLADDLDQIDWPESTKIAQRNWIGRSEGAEIDFQISGLTKSRITVFTTRPDTLFGATYLVLAPEHALVQALSQKLENGDEVRKYVAAAKNKTDLERQEEAKDKTGVELKGVRAINPATGEEIPIYVADYVLGGYGTGAIMAVPAHDERDYQFAKKFELPIKRVIEPKFVASSDETKLREGEEIVKRNAICAIIRNPKDGTYLCNVWKSIEMHGLLTGGVEDGEDKIEAAKREIREETGYKNVRLVSDPKWVINTLFYQRQKKQNRWARFHYLYFELENEERDPIDPAELEKHEFVWKKKEELKDFFTVFEGEFILNLLDDPDYIHTGSGVLGNSGEFDGIDSEAAKKKIVEKVGGKMVKTYRLRDWLISRQRYWGAPIPVVYDPEGKPHPIPEEHLPWLLPTDVEFSPKGTSPLGQSKELLERTEKIFGKGWKPEIDTMDTFVCSSWYYFRFADPKNEDVFASKEMLKKWLPVDLYVGGAEHTVLHLLYSRFITKALQKHDLIGFNEPFKKLRHPGLILSSSGAKISKSKGNSVSPDELVERYGADTLRMYEMFLGPFNMAKPWNDENIIGIRRFLERVWKLEAGDGTLDAKTETLLHQTIKKVGEDLDGLKMNTAISSLMILLNELETLPNVPKTAYGAFLALLAPLAPHMANELAEKAGADISAWPSYEEAKLASATVVVAVQVNGKTRGTVELAPGAGEEEALAAARGEAGVAKWLALGKEVKAVYVPGKVISFVIQQV
ncbi:MAG TPA: leucine--tRNA ligase [Candidatus Paceibacterota bacterium]|nr:leucine--tRNA ligase [Candidatus Paceibacterota bacterium]